MLSMFFIPCSQARKSAHTWYPQLGWMFSLSSSGNQSRSCQLCFATSLGYWFPRLWHMVCKKAEKNGYLTGGRHFHVPSAFAGNASIQKISKYHLLPIKISPKTHRHLDSGCILWCGKGDSSRGNTGRENNTKSFFKNNHMETTSTVETSWNIFVYISKKS